jgi:hypothetical protein
MAHRLLLTVIFLLFPVNLWVFWRDGRIMQARHRRMRDELRWFHFEELMRLDRFKREVRALLEDER